MRNEPIKANALKCVPMIGLIVIEQLKIKSVYEDLKAEKNVILTKEQIASYNKQMIESTGDATKVWSQHPDQGVVVAIHPEDAETYELRCGDKIAFNHSEYTGALLIYNKKRYICLRPGEIIMRYLTSEV